MRLGLEYLSTFTIIQAKCFLPGIRLVWVYGGCGKKVQEKTPVPWSTWGIEDELCWFQLLYHCKTFRKDQRSNLTDPTKGKYPRQFSGTWNMVVINIAYVPEYCLCFRTPQHRKSHHNGTRMKRSHPTSGSHPKQVFPPWYTSFSYP